MGLQKRSYCHVDKFRICLVSALVLSLWANAFIRIAAAQDNRDNNVAIVTAMHRGFQFPLDAKVQKQYRSSTQGGTRERSYDVRLRRSAKMIAYTRDRSGFYRFNLEERLARNGEIIILDEIRADTKEQQESLGSKMRTTAQLFSKEVNPGGGLPIGDVVSDSDNPVLGCIDGYFFHEYFPVEETKVAPSGDGFLLTCTTNLGIAQCTLDPAQDYVPTSVTIEKKSEHRTTGGRRLGDVQFAGVPESAIVAKSLQLKDVEIGTKHGAKYIKSCKLETTVSSRRGHEGTLVSTWLVDSIALDPKFDNGLIPTTIGISNGERVICDGAEQLPYVWSASEQWAVPMATELDGSQSHRRGWIVVLALGGMLAASALFLLKRRGV